MARNREFYKGSRKKRNYALIPFIIVLSILVLLVVLFYSMQKYAVITKDGVAVELPGMEKEATTVNDQGKVVKVFDPVETTLEFVEPDYSRIEATAGRDVKPVRAIYIAADDISRDNLLDKAARLNDGNALMLEMKPRTGVLLWNSEAPLAQDYGLFYQTELTNSMPNLIAEIKAYGEEQEKEIYLVAQISCCIDSLLASRSIDFALRTEFGMDYIDSKGAYLDPYNADVRRYVVQLVQELWDMGFDEVVLADVLHPVQDTSEGQTPVTFLYTAEMSTTPNPVNGVCGFAIYVANALQDRAEGKFLSIYCDTPQALVRDDTGTGQNAVLFMKIYDRVYYRTDKYTYTNFNLKDIEGSVLIGKANDRFVPVVENYLPDNSSWIYIETEQE